MKLKDKPLISYLFDLFFSNKQENYILSNNNLLEVLFFQYYIFYGCLKIFYISLTTIQCNKLFTDIANIIFLFLYDLLPIGLLRS